MKVNRLASIMLTIGPLCVALSIAWWGVVYTMVAKQTGESLFSSISCL